MNNTTSLQSSVKHKSGLDVLTKYRGAVMGIAALWILFFHEWQLLSTEPGKLADFENYIKRIGFCGVDIFLFLSGIGLVFAIGKKSILSFYYRRLKRVYLPFLIVGIIRAVTEKWTSEGFRDNVLCISFYKTNMYSFLWFVPAILTLYLLFPLYYKIFFKIVKQVNVYRGNVCNMDGAVSVFQRQAKTRFIRIYKQNTGIFIRNLCRTSY